MSGGTLFRGGGERGTFARPNFSRQLVGINLTMAEAILARWKEYSPVQQRKAAAILGALVADAAGRLAAVVQGPVLCQKPICCIP